MLIKQLLWRNPARYSPPESPPLAHQDPASLRLPLVISHFLSSLPPSRFSFSFHLLSMLFCFNHFLSPHSAFDFLCPPLFLPLSVLYLWVVITVIFLPSTHFPAKSQHPVYLCTGHAILHLPSSLWSFSPWKINHPLCISSHLSS